MADLLYCTLISLSQQTGPKGVLKDWRRYRQMETEKRKEKERERRQLAKKLTLTCRSHVSNSHLHYSKLYYELLVPPCYSMIMSLLKYKNACIS